MCINREDTQMARVIDLECDLPTAEAAAFRASGSGDVVLGSGDTFRGREAPAVPGHGMANYANIFRSRAGDSGTRGQPVLSLDDFAALLERAGVEKAVVGTAQQPSNDY